MRNRWQVKVVIGGLAASVIVHANKRERKTRLASETTHDATAVWAANKSNIHSEAHSIISHWLWLNTIDSSTRMEQWTAFQFFCRFQINHFQHEICDLMLDQKNGENKKISCPFLIENLFYGSNIAQRSRQMLLSKIFHNTLCFC